MTDTERDERDERRRRLFDQLRQDPDGPARDRLVEEFIPLAEYFAGRYRNRGLEADDLRQVAKLALVKAIDRFDPDHGTQFSTFAGRTIDGELKRHFRDRSWAVRVPRSLKERAALVRAARERLSGELDRAPTVAEIAEACELDADEVLVALDVQGAYRASSLDVGRSDDDDEGPVRTFGAADQGYDHVTSRMLVDDLLATLPERERTIVTLRFFERMSQSEIAERVGVSQMHVSRLLRRSLEQLRGTLEAD